MLIFFLIGNTLHSASIEQKVEKIGMVPQEKKQSKPFDTISSNHKLKENLNNTFVAPKYSSETLASSVNQINLDRDRPSASTSVSDEKYKPDKWMQLDQDKEALRQLNLAIVSCCCSYCLLHLMVVCCWPMQD
jgi:hypothetical protein